MVQQRKALKREPVLRPGAALDRDLTVVDHLGGSRKVDIYLCRSRRLKKLVSCKVLRPEYCVDFSSLQAVLEEGEILMELRHPNVVEGYGVDLENRPRIVMQHLEGQTVASAFLSGNIAAFRVVDAVNVALQIADALSYVHQQGLLHLDVKPSNVMLHNGHATLIDFSVAERFSPDHPLRDNAGTWQYMAPEQTHRREVGYATDVFGLGVTLFQLVAGGRLPYPAVEGEEGDSVRELDYEKAPLSPREINQAVPEALAAVVLKAIDIEPSARFATPAELREALLATR